MEKNRYEILQQDIKDTEAEIIEAEKRIDDELQAVKKSVDDVIKSVVHERDNIKFWQKRNKDAKDELQNLGAGY